MTQCSYYYHSWSNAPARRCRLDEGHKGQHEEEIVQAQCNYQSFQDVGWRKH